MNNVLKFKVNQKNQLAPSKESVSAIDIFPSPSFLAALRIFPSSLISPIWKLLETLLIAMIRSSSVIASELFLASFLKISASGCPLRFCYILSTSETCSGLSLWRRPSLYLFITKLASI